MHTMQSPRQRISIHSLRMEGDPKQPVLCVLRTAISIHSLRMEGDGFSFKFEEVSRTFQSTPSAWRETCLQWWQFRKTRHFNPLPPHGGRPTLSGSCTQSATFQSTPSAWRETGQDHGTRLCRSKFQSTPSAWRETFRIFLRILRKPFQSTPSAWRETLQAVCDTNGWDFNPLPPHGGRLQHSCFLPSGFAFQSTPSAWRETCNFDHESK